MNNMVDIVGIGCLFIGTLLLIAALSAFFIWFSWNWVMPDVCGLPPITLWQAFGFAILSHALVKSASISSSSK